MGDQVFQGILPTVLPGLDARAPEEGNPGMGTNPCVVPLTGLPFSGALASKPVLCGTCSRTQLACSLLSVKQKAQVLFCPAWSG